MGNIFRFDSPLMKFMTLITNLMCLNVLWLLCSLPLVTAGAATTAMQYVIFQYISKKDDSVLKPFFRAFKENFRTATPLWIPNLLIGAALAAEVFYLSSGAQMWLKVLFGIVAFIYLGATSYLYPLLARYDAPPKNAIINSFALSIRHLGSTVCLVILNAAPVAVMLFAPEVFMKLSMLWLLGGFALIAYLDARILMPVFKKYEPQETEE